jgi:hypothetical protein
MGAAGVELFNPLIPRKLLVSLEGTSAQNASLPGRRYKNGTNSATEKPHLRGREYWPKRPIGYFNPTCSAAFFGGAVPNAWR